VIKISDRLNWCGCLQHVIFTFVFEYLPGVQNEEALNRTKMENLPMLMGVYQTQREKSRIKADLNSGMRMSRAGLPITESLAKWPHDPSRLHVRVSKKVPNPFRFFVIGSSYSSPPLPL